MRVSTLGRLWWLPLFAALASLPANAQSLTAQAPPLQARYVPTPDALRGGLELLYNQIQGTATSGIVSQNNTSATQFNNIAADDFVIPAGQTWNVSQMVARGFYTTQTGGTPGTCQNADISFWSNGAGNRPGTVLSTVNVPPATDATGVLTFNFPGVSLAAGTYWASVVCNGANLNLGVNSRWNWFYNTVQRQQPAQLRNDNGGFNLPQPGWNSINSLGAGIGPDFDFSLSGTSSGTAQFPQLSVSPVPLTATAPSGASTTATLTIANTGTAPLTYSFPAFATLQRVRELAALGIDVNRHAPVLDTPFGKGVEGLSSPGGNARDFRVGGPDAFGYTFIDSNEPGGPAPGLIDISATGAPVTLAAYTGCTAGGPGDEGRAAVTLPFSFSFYGTEYTEAFVYANGVIGFDPAFAACTFTNSATIPNTAGINGFLAPWWDDLDLTTTGSIRTQTLPDGRFAIQYTNVPRFGSTEVGRGNTFQAIIAPNGSFEFRYGALTAAAQNSQTIGIENQTGTVGLLVNANTAGYAVEGLAIAFAKVPDFISGVSPATGTVAPGASQAVTVTLNAFEGSGNTPVAPGTYTRSITLTSNDPNAASTSIPVTLTVTAPSTDPLVVTPNPVRATLNSGATGTRPVTITNNTAAPVTYSFPQYTSLTAAPAERTVHAGYELPKGVEDTRNGNQTAFRDMGGPDAFGYQWIDSDSPGGPVFNWTSIASTGTAVTLGDDTSVTVPLPFTFSFYGADQTSVRIVSNGFLAFGGTSNSFTNVAIPTAAVPNNFIAGYWDDLNPAAGGTVHHGTLNGEFVVQFTNVPRFGGTTGTITFQMILSPTGAIRYQYLTVPTTNNSATIGIENATGTDGLQIAFNTPYAAPNKAVLIQARPAFVTAVTPASGTIAPNSSVTVNVAFSAAGLLGGVYTGEIDLVTSIGNVDVGVELTVIGSPTVTVNPTALAFGDLIVGFTATRELTVTNNGTSALEISGITSNNGAFTVSPTTATIAPGASQVFTVTFTPTAVGPVSGMLSIVSNAGTSPTMVAVSGNGLAAPAFSATPSPLNITVRAGQTATGTVTLNNTGAGAGTFAASARFVPPTLAPVVADAATPEQRDAAADLLSQTVGAPTGAPVGDLASDPSCSASPGLVIQDDGTAENAYSSNPATIQFTTFVDRYTPAVYPAAVTRVCFAMVGLTGASPTMPYTLQVFAADGAGGTPGTLLGSVEGTATNIPIVAGLPIPVVWQTIDTSSLNLSVASGSIFIGVRFPTSSPNRFIAADESATRPAGFAGGFNRTESAGTAAPWAPIQTGFAAYRALLVRPTIIASGPALLSVAPASGSVAAGGSQVLTLTVDATGSTNADVGTYQAQIVIETNDPANPTVTVPVTITVTPIVSNENGRDLPAVATLYAPFPNPMASAATVRFALPEAAPVRLHVYDVAGRLVQTLVEGDRAAGFHDVAFDSRSMAVGTYVVRMQAGEVMQTMRLSVVR